MKHGVEQLAYLVLGVQELSTWDQMLTSTIGMARVDPAPESGTLKFRIDERASRLILEPAPKQTMLAMGLQVHDKEALLSTAERLTASGMPVQIGTDQEASARDVMGLLRSQDPEGNPIEVCWGSFQDERLPQWGIQHAGFVASELGLGHVFLGSRDRQAAVDFYCSVLGFRISDHMLLHGREITFLHCNPRHHSIAIIEDQALALANPLHFMVELRDFDDVGRALERCEDNDVPIWLSLGKHSNDLMTSFYLKAPGGTAIEVGASGRLVDDSTWQITKHFRDSLWGHRDLTERK